ncbi:daunorubicin C-13 ketoreductase [Salinibacter sp. 10B]|uniref:SDR family NAD(P)-dependent oxidoreductase n=1 Tax=Salinibacter sp. 10B TaxID=1923971 RepID=UPI000CF46D43|nr:SDR family NAD(P)-dependent oxidoreductase [Salinibacter sp. 10B]PQJ34720.1 daunorubicin C-13 ketoreductase [Salinibacter sp. 10B]
MSQSPEARANLEETDLSDQTALVTGSTNGIGRAVALALGRLGADVLVHGRESSAGESLVEELTDLSVRATFVQADFADPDSVLSLAETAQDWCDGLDLLFNNAGALFQAGDRTPTGIERTFQVNHLAPYLLTAQLLDHLRDGARIVTTASDAHRGAVLNLERVRGSEPFSGMEAYSHSKLANILFASELARRLDATGRAVQSHSVHPGFVPGSQFGRFLPGPLSGLFRMLGVVPGTASVADGAAELLHAALSPDAAETSGRYFTGRAPVEPSSAARDADAAARLWTRSAEMLDMAEPLADARPRSSAQS